MEKKVFFYVCKGIYDLESFFWGMVRGFGGIMRMKKTFLGLIRSSTVKKTAIVKQLVRSFRTNNRYILNISYGIIYFWKTPMQCTHKHTCTHCLNRTSMTFRKGFNCWGCTHQGYEFVEECKKDFHIRSVTEYWNYPAGYSAI